MVESRDKDIVGISEAFASGGRVAMAGPRMDFAADRLQSSGFETVRCAPGDGAGLAVIDPGGTFGGTISPRRLLRLVAGHPLAAIFVSEATPAFAEQAFFRLQEAGYRLRPESSKFASSGSIRWLILEQVAEGRHLIGNETLREEMAAVARARAVAHAAVDGDMLVYLAEGRDGESLRMYRPGGRITVLGATYGHVDTAQTVYGPSNVDYRVMRSNSLVQRAADPLAGFYVPCFLDMTGDVVAAMQQAKPLLMQDGLLAMAVRNETVGLSVSTMVDIIGKDPGFHGVSTLIMDGDALVTARSSALSSSVSYRRVLRTGLSKPVSTASMGSE